MNEDYYITLIYKKLSEEIDPIEIKELEAWLNASEENRSMANRVEKAWNVSSTLEVDLEIDLEQEFADLETRIKEDEKGQEAIVRNLPPKKEGINFSWWRIAASLLLLASIGLLVTKQLNKATTDASEILVINTEDQPKEVVLSDGSRIYLNSHSQLSYPKQFDKKTARIVDLKGEAFFEVEHNDNQAFQVQTNREVITVLGTSFNVLSNENQSLTSVYVVSGKVQVEQRESKETQILEKGQKCLSDFNQKQISLEESSQNDLAWYTQELVFLATPLSQVKLDIERLYQVELIFEKENLANCSFTSTFKNESLETILFTMSKVLGLEVEQKKDTQYILKGGSCE